ncbi:MAG: GLPGLI family protein [Bacteroides sp.]|nr:GLPGLI family protein [Bacteroides sp.]
MKYLFLCLLFGLTSNKMWAQIIKDKEPAIIEVHYIKTAVADTLENRSNSDPMTLRIGRTSAMFYPTKKMWQDSLLRTDFALHEKLYYELNPPGQSEWKPLGGIEREYLFRNINDGETMVYRRIAGDGYSYTEPTEMPVWQILSETKEVMGYSCQLASCDFRGRKWYAWFSTDIPINEGPWKLFGLPGLVLEAYDSKKHYVYTAVGLYTQNLQPVGIKLYVRYEPYKLKSRQEFLQKMYKEEIEGDFAFKMSALHGNGAQSAPSRADYDFQERDYQQSKRE